MDIHEYDVVWIVRRPGAHEGLLPAFEFSCSAQLVETCSFQWHLVEEGTWPPAKNIHIWQKYWEVRKAAKRAMAAAKATHYGDVKRAPRVA